MITTTEQTLRELLTVMWLDNHIELTDGPDDIDDVVTVGEAAIDAALDAKPDNWTLRELYADWLEVQGNSRCESQRWMETNSKCPRYNSDWTWFDYGVFQPENMCCDLCENIFQFIESDEEYKQYPTRTAAELDLHNALVKAGEITCEEVTA